MFMVGNTRRNRTRRAAFAVLGRAKGPRLGKCDLLPGAFFQPSTLNTGGNWKRFLFLNEQSWNVIENKGPLWKTLG
jgi:hypothetical protein